MAEGDMDKLREIYVFVAFVVGVGSLILAVFQAWSEKPASALWLGAAFVACGMFLFLSQIKTFKIWEIQVELNQTLDQAKVVMDRLRQLSEISAKSTYMQMAWGNRMGTPTASEKQAILDEVDAQLNELKATPKEVDAIKKPFVQMVKLDFYFLYTRTIRSYAELRYTALIERANRHNTPEANAAREAHSTRITAWTARTNNTDPMARLANSSLEDELVRFSPRDGEWLDAREREIAEDFRNLIVRLNADCEKKGGYTPQAASYYDKQNDRAKELTAELFSNILNDLRK